MPELRFMTDLWTPRLMCWTPLWIAQALAGTLGSSAENLVGYRQLSQERQELSGNTVSQRGRGSRLWQRRRAAMLTSNCWI